MSGNANSIPPNFKGQLIEGDRKSPMDVVISVVKVISIAATGAFGALGLLTKYKDDDTGKINRWGKIALSGIILSALLSLSLQFLEKTRDAQKAADDAERAEAAATRTAKKLEDILVTAQTTADQQKANLEVSTGLKEDLQTSLDTQNLNLKQTTEVTRKMDVSLKAQEEVLIGNKNIFGGIVEGAERETKNTIGILRTIWNESNRVVASQVTAVVTFEYMTAINRPPPRLFDGGESMTVRVVDRNASQSLALPLNAWKSSHVLKPDSLTLTAHEQTINISTHPTTGGPSYTQSSYFTRFDGDMKSFSDMLSWNGAVFEFVLRKNDPELVGSLSKALAWDPSDRDDRKWFDETLKREYTVPDLGDDYSITTLPVHARLVLYIRDRPVGKSEAWLVKAWEHDEDVRGLIVAKFKMSRIADSTFSAFQPTF